MNADNKSVARRIAIKRVEKFCWGLGCLLLGFYTVAHVHAAVGRWQAIEAFQQAQVQMAASGGAAAADVTVDTSLWAEGRIEAYKNSLATDMDAPEGLLRIPSIELTVPIFKGTDELKLNRGVGRIDGTAAPGVSGNMGIAGHRDGFFRGLKDVQVGDVIEVVTLDATLSYRIAGFKIVDPSNIDVLEPGSEAMLTLVTCYPFYFIGHAPKRYIVQAVRVDPADLPI